ncbi:DUF397 domain-containing protein [Streptomyces sodiiphilus]|uniref:DUF397 domain-containing protein n=1 Tax=Streptomyces sodiiphilus TaxID=226217 RepID=A0ABN2PQ87_9ACTN
MTAQPRPAAATLTAARWITSSYSAGGNECVSVASLGTWAGIRDSMNPTGPALLVPADAFSAFLAYARTEDS